MSLHLSDIPGHEATPRTARQATIVHAALCEGGYPYECVSANGVVVMVTHSQAPSDGLKAALSKAFALAWEEADHA